MKKLQVLLLLRPCCFAALLLGARCVACGALYIAAAARRSRFPCNWRARRMHRSSWTDATYGNASLFQLN
jgi:hypothetical protein